MSCNCKQGFSEDKVRIDNEKQLPITVKTKNFLVRFIVFMVFVIISPIWYIYILWLAFKGLVLSKSLDVSATIKMLSNSLNKKEDEEEYEDFDSLTEDDVILTNVEDITNKYGE